MSSLAHDAPAAAVAHGFEEPDPGVPVRWLILLGIPFIVGGTLFALGIALNEMWLLALASLFGPGAIILGFTYLGITSDTNRLE